jgi:hypothetical protein
MTEFTVAIERQIRRLQGRLLPAEHGLLPRLAPRQTLGQMHASQLHASQQKSISKASDAHLNSYLTIEGTRRRIQHSYSIEDTRRGAIQAHHLQTIESTRRRIQ